METLTYSSGRASGCDSPGLLNQPGDPFFAAKRYSAVPNGFIPFFKTVFAYSSVPQRMNDPKSLYQSPAGACGSVLTQLLNR